MSYLFHTYPEQSGKGKSSCQFRLGEAYLKMGGRANANISYRFFDEEAENRTTFKNILLEVREKARGKLLPGLRLS